MTPDMTAEMWLEAAGWAWGSQTWKGKTPALEPKPTKQKMKTRVFSEALSPSAEKPRLEVWD